MKAVVLLSGGLDSATCLAIARSQAIDLYALSFDYGQRHKVELRCAEVQAAAFNVCDHKVIRLDLRAFGGSALTDEIDVPKGEESTGIPITYVPARNTVFLSYALAYAEVLESQDIFIGVNAVDYSGYPDCRPEFLKAFQQLANLATKSAVEGHPVTIHAPLLNLKKTEIIQLGLSKRVDYAYTSSCYDPSPAGAPCLLCDSCRIRTAAFQELGHKDPLLQLVST